MSSSIVIITDKVMRMTRSMVYLAMRYAPGQGATVGDLVQYLNEHIPAGEPQLHGGIVERVMQELCLDGRVSRRATSEPGISTSSRESPLQVTVARLGTSRVCPLRRLPVLPEMSMPPVTVRVPPVLLPR